MSIESLFRAYSTIISCFNVTIFNTISWSKCTRLAPCALSRLAPSVLQETNNSRDSSESLSDKPGAAEQDTLESNYLEEEQLRGTALETQQMNDLPEEGNNTESKVHLPAEAVEPVQRSQTADRTQSGQIEEAHGEIPDLETEVSQKLRAANSESEVQSSEQLNPFEQLDGLSNVMSQLMPGSDQATGFDMGEMKETFSNANLTGSFASMDIKPGGEDGLLADTVPVPPDMQGIWEQMHAIQLPEVRFSHDSTDMLFDRKICFGCCLCSLTAVRICYRCILDESKSSL